MAEIAGEDRQRDADQMGDLQRVPAEAQGGEGVFAQADADDPDLRRGKQIDDGEAPKFVRDMAARSFEDEEPAENIRGHHAAEIGRHHRECERHQKIQKIAADQVDQRGKAAGQHEADELPFFHGARRSVPPFPWPGAPLPTRRDPRDNNNRCRRSAARRSALPRRASFPGNAARTLVAHSASARPGWR